MENRLQRNGQMGRVLAALLVMNAGWNAPVRAESIVIPDNTLGAESSVVNSLDALNQIVEGGAVRESNLFHSFLEFNVAEDYGVYFANPADIESILTRVTGDNRSNIFGRLGVLGEANLFLLNPNGIVFGENASLDVNGSFYASTAEAISLGEGVFSATEPESSQLLTVNPEVTFFSYLTPGLGEINNSGELSVGARKTLTLLGDTVLSSGALTAPGGTVRVLGNFVGLVDQATVDVSGATGGGTVLVGGDYQGQGVVPAAERTFVGSEVVIAADAIDVGDGGQVIVWADGATRFGGRISAQGGPQGGDGGFVEVSGLEFLDFAGEVNTQAVDGEAGQLLLDPANILIAEVAPVGFITVGHGDEAFADFLYGEAEDAGQNSHITPETVFNLLNLNDLILEATDTIAVNNNVVGISRNDLTLKASNIEVNNAFLWQVGGGDIILETLQTVGNSVILDNGEVRTDIILSDFPENGGDIRITTHDLTVRNDGVISAINSIEGDSGQILLEATGDILVDGTNSRIRSQVFPGTVGDSGGIIIATDNLFVLNDARITATTAGEGTSGPLQINAVGDIVVEGAEAFISSQVNENGIGDSSGVTITATNVSVLNGAEISASTFGTGTAGQVQIEAVETILADGMGSLISSQVMGNATGNSGGVVITASNLFVQNGAGVVTSTFSQGNSGPMQISVTGNISVLNDGILNAGTFGEGNSGQINIEAGGNVEVNGEDSAINSQVDSAAAGDSGGINIVAANLSLLNGAMVDATTFGRGRSGQIQINAAGDILVDDSLIGSAVFFNALGNSEGIEITANNLTIQNGGVAATNLGQGNSGPVEITANNLTIENTGFLGASTAGQGNSGRIEIDVADNILVKGNSSISSQVLSNAIGDSGGITITTTNLSLLNSGRINANTSGEGDSGLIQINAVDEIIVEENSFIISQVSSNAVGNNSSAGISIVTTDLLVLDDSSISASTFSEGTSGQIQIQAKGDIVVRGDQSFIASQVGPNALGNSEGVVIDTINLYVLDSGEISASTFGEGTSGQIQIDAADRIAVMGSSSLISSQVRSNATGDSEGITITTTDISVLDSGAVSAATFGRGNSGQIQISATGEVLVQDAFIASQVDLNAIGNSEGITITTANLSVLDTGQVNASTFGEGTAGSIMLQSHKNTDFNILLTGGGLIAATTSSQDQGGDIILKTSGDLTIRDGGNLTTASLETSTGAAGDLNIFADSVLLDDGVELSTQTASVEGGGNINFFVDGGIILRRGSFINAESTNEDVGSGSGGNITLNADAVVAIPTENSDIIANAVGGDGGNIIINAAGIFGLTEQNVFRTTDELRANNSSDISASSQSGQQGTINLNADFEQTQALDELPDNFINADQLVASSCIARSGDVDSAFAIAGNGGLPQQPDSATGGYSTGTIQTVPEATGSQSFQEPTGVYQLADGRLVMSQECQE